MLKFHFQNLFLLVLLFAMKEEYHGFRRRWSLAIEDFCEDFVIKAIYYKAKSPI